jgi:hypothetical protein
MTVVVAMQFGSHLYGTATPNSDHDYKVVYLPPARDILLQRVTNTSWRRPEKDPTAKNSPGDHDEEAYALHHYVKLLGEGYTGAIDMLFAPDAAMLQTPARVWRIIQRNKERFLSRKAAGFVSYCQQQANKYGIKGSRMHAVRVILTWFDTAIARYGPHAKLQVAAEQLPEFLEAQKLEHTRLIELDNRGLKEWHLECCGKKAPFLTSLKETRAIFQRIFDTYGERARLAERNEGVDWKALSHAVRVGHEALALLQTGGIEFPLSNAGHLLRIKRGELPYKVVAGEIELLLQLVTEAQAGSVLPEEPDYNFMDMVVEDAYRARVSQHAT